MKQYVSRTLEYMVVIAIGFMLSFVPRQAAAKVPVKVAVLPFTINAQTDHTYLQNGITELLTFKLSKEGISAVVDQELSKNALKTTCSRTLLMKAFLQASCTIGLMRCSTRDLGRYLRSSLWSRFVTRQRKMEKRRNRGSGSRAFCPG